MLTVRQLLGRLHDSQSTAEAKLWIKDIIDRSSEDMKSIREFIYCGHVDWDDLLLEECLKAGLDVEAWNKKNTIIQTN